MVGENPEWLSVHKAGLAKQEASGTFPAGAVSVPVFTPVAKTVLPTLRKLLVLDAGVSTAFDVPMRMLLEPVCSVVAPTLYPMATLFVPVVTANPASLPRAVL